MSAVHSTSSQAPLAGGRGAHAAGPWTWHPGRYSIQLIAFSVFILAVLWSAVVYQVRRESVAALSEAKLNLSNLTRAFAEHTAKTLEGADQAVRFIRAEYLTHGQSLDIASYLRSKEIIGSAYHLLSVIGPDGFASHSTQPFQRVDLSDREHFRVHATASEDRLFVSKPVLGRVSGKWSVQLTRRVNLPDGSFGGVVVVSLAPEYLTRFYGDVDLGTGGVIVLVGHDGIVRARASSERSPPGQDVSGGTVFAQAMKQPAGHAMAVSKVDGVDRLWAWRHLDEYGLVVLTGTAGADVYAESNARARMYVVGSALMTLTLLIFVAGLLQKARQQATLVRQLRVSEKQANAANEMKTRFLASVSHELRTPLNGILGYAELIRDGESEQDHREFGGIIHDSARHLHKLVDMILDLAKIESGRMELVVTEVDAHEVLRHARDLNAVHASARGLEFEFEVDPVVPLRLRTDRTRLLQILNNLLSNAIKFTDRGRVTVKAGAEGGVLRIEVSDTGVGIDPRQLSTLFTRFQATSNEFTHPAQGAGIGLPLSHELALLLGGDLQVRSTPGVGTSVSLRLPLQPPVPEKA